ncbi:hypothetical protein [Microlunatus sp. Y2014]|uniref:hypothetical protein n=1 Tax=Microlunatus sp. Y2014 TaxID=3418488 RepID=UPI003DA7868A
MSPLALYAHTEACFVHLAQRQRDSRGNNSIEMAIIIGAVIVVATLVVVAIKAAVDARLPKIK